MNNVPLIRVYVNKFGYLSPIDFLVTPKKGILIYDEEDKSWKHPPEDWVYVVETFTGVHESGVGEVRKIFEGDLVLVEPTDLYDTIEPFYGEVMIEDGNSKVFNEHTGDSIPLYDPKFFRNVSIIGNTWGSPYHPSKIQK